MSEQHTFKSLHDEFVLIGPFGQKDQVLARSETAGMDLIGCAMDKDDDDFEPSYPFPFPFSILFGSKRQLHRVSSWPVKNPNPDEDERRTSFRFAWSGFCSSGDRAAIEKSFNANILDISQAVADGDRERLELSLAPVLLRCSRANERFVRRRRLMSAFLLAYFFIVVVGLFGAWIQNFLLSIRDFN